MKVYIKGLGMEIDLTQRDLVGQGGQGSVYAKGQTAYKVYHDPKDMLPEGKILELAEIDDPNIIRPLAVLTAKSGQPIGYSSRFVRNAWVLCQLFPAVFRQREGLTSAQTYKLIEKLRERITNVHAAGVLIVDANEMNFLVAKDFSDVYGIDVDSYQTPHYPAPAIMDSIRDWQAKSFTQLSDWFSFAVLAFQMFVGIHPYKGRYHGRKDAYRGRLPGDADDDSFAIARRRMQGNISVFHKDVSVPGSVLPFSIIPDDYRRWFEAVLARGERLVPPSGIVPVVAVAPVPVPKTAGTGKLDVMEIGSFEGQILGVWTSTAIVVSTDRGTWLNGARVPIGSSRHCAFSQPTGRTVVILSESDPDGAPVIYNLTDRGTIRATCAYVPEEVSSYDGRLYFRSPDVVHEVALCDMGAQVYPTFKPVVQVLPHASRLYPGVVVQRLLGTTYVSLLSGPGMARQMKLPELDGYRVIDARFEGTGDRGVLMVVGEHRGRYDRLVYRFDLGTQENDLRTVQGVSPAGLNFVVLDSGVCVLLDEEDRLEVFHARPGTAQVQHVEVTPTFAGMRLWKQGGTLLASRGERLYRLRMK